MSDYNYQQYLIRLQESNVLDGITNEPRVFYDTIPLGLPFVEEPSHPGTFRNGEDFPIRLTHMTMAMKRIATFQGQPVAIDPRTIQRVGVRLKFHDQYYMNRYAANPINPAIERQLFVPATSWALDSVAPPELLAAGTAAWEFQRPFILSVRDTLRVDVQLDEAPGAATAYPVAATFTGIGVLSKRPYFFSGQIFVTDAQRATIDTDNFRNDGSEPVMVTNMTVSVSASLLDPNPTGNVNRVSIGVRQIGNGTNSAWVAGPVNEPDISPDLVPAILLGQQSGNALVHRFPGHGLLWAPGEGISVEVQSQVIDVTGPVQIGLLGYISVQ